MKDETPVMTITADGSPTLYLPTIDEHYHSVKGAVAESRHVYIDMALRASGKKEIDLFECGLGTGLNAFLSLLESEKSDCRIRYTVIEAYPLAPEQAIALGYPDIIAPEYRTLFEQIHSCDWGKPVNITPRFSLHKIKGDLMTTRWKKTATMSSTSMRLLPKNSPKCGVPNYWDALPVLSGKKGFFLPIAPKAKYAAVCNKADSSCIALPARPEERERYCRPYAFLPKTGNIPHIKK